jgi:hypothetical protein
MSYVNSITRVHLTAPIIAQKLSRSVYWEDSYRAVVFTLNLVAAIGLPAQIGPRVSKIRAKKIRLIMLKSNQCAGEFDVDQANH